MTVEDILSQATLKLRDAGVETARLDTLILLEAVLSIDRAYILAHPERLLSPAEITTLNKICIQRMAHVPLAYLLGRAYFYGRRFFVSPAVLIPRPESESMIHLALSLPSGTIRAAADIGTGSGCLGITLALEQPGISVDAYDISTDALEVARKNAGNLSATIGAYRSDLLRNTRRSYDLLLANLPYVPDAYPINQAATHEPALALYAGADGLDAYRSLWQQLAERDDAPQYVITEALQQQHGPLAVLAETAGYKESQTDGLAQLFTRRYV